MDNVRFIRDDTRRMAKAKRFKGKPTEVTAALKALRERAHVTMADLARQAGYKGASSYQRYENPDLYNKPHLPPNLVLRLTDILVDRGEPPVTIDEVMALGPWPIPGQGRAAGRRLRSVKRQRGTHIMKAILAMIAALILSTATASACEFDTDCYPGSACIKNGGIYGVCVGGIAPGNDNDRQPAYSPLDPNRTYGDTCSFDTDCGPGSSCVKGNGIYGTCMR